MKGLFTYLAIALIAFGCQPNETSTETNEEIVQMEEAPTQKDLLRHVVLFSFKDSSSPEDIKKVEDAFIALEDKIPQIRDFEWGVNNSPEGLNKGLTHCFLVTFESEEDREIYLPHPDHQAFVEVLSPHMEDVTVIDYWAK
ncbi:Dabb family protein [Cyclobacterium jeungdonense]|uniref:Dabb family protein n=1 Tax=Cyclobacterium jeungdonense TaxID=708087 RepID=A0ABT8C772_9BACT|nr:Dabb family protein [Cyclobacterium jeungdonense]MDN3688361.1 Dabb family protein [Cyclobacterium jeungdonense]